MTDFIKWRLPITRCLWEATLLKILLRKTSQTPGTLGEKGGRMVKRFLLFIFVFSLFSGSSFAERVHYHLVRILKPPREKILALEDLGAIINGPYEDYLLVEIPIGNEKKLEDLGLYYEILIPDVTSFYDENFKDARYHTYQEFLDTLSIIATNNPNICKLETLGVSAGGRRIVVLKITDNPNLEEEEPEILFEGNTHGDEKIGSEVCFNFILHLVRNYGTDPLITNLVNTREIWVSPVVNPDGHIANTRYNANGVDLNRDYGYVWDGEGSSPSAFSQPETRAFRDLGLRNNFYHWTSFHAGTYFISAPWSYSPFQPRDSLELKYLGLNYRSFTGYPYAQGYHGMYEIHGSSKDFAYGVFGSTSWSVEICILKTPPADSIQPISNREIPAMLFICRMAKRGIEGVVYDSLSGRRLKAMVIALPNDWPCYTDSVLGDFHRFLLPGTYSLKVISPGYRTKTISNITVPSDTSVFVSIPLVPDSSFAVSGFMCPMCRLKDGNVISSFTNLSLEPRDGRRLSIGVGGWTMVDMGKVITNGPGNDFTVYEDDSDPEGYRVEVALSLDGPWTSLGSDTGTSSFDLARGGISSCRYIKIIDDGDGTNNPTAGFDLDAIEALVANLPSLSLSSLQILDPPPGNNNGRLDPGERVGLILNIANLGRISADSVYLILREQDPYIEILDSLAFLGNVPPESTRRNLDSLIIFALPNTPRERRVNFLLRFDGRNYHDSLNFVLTVGEITASDPIPDSIFRYWAYDNTDTLYPECPVYNWVEIRGVGTRLPINSDDQTIRIKLPFVFKYYGQRYTDSLSICSNGWISPIRTTSTAYTNQPLPDPTSTNPSAMICLNWDDLVPTSAPFGIHYLYDSINHRMIIEYDSIRYFSPSTAWERFQIIIYDTTVATPTGDNLFLVQYATGNYYQSSTIGIEDHTNTIGINYLFNNNYHRGAAPIISGRAIKYTTQGITFLSEARKGNHNRVNLFPNPFSNRIKLSLSQLGSKIEIVSIYTLDGRLVTRISPDKNNEIEWDGKDQRGRVLPKGIYLLRIGEKTLKAIKIR